MKKMVVGALCASVFALAACGGGASENKTAPAPATNTTAPAAPAGDGAAGDATAPAAAATQNFDILNKTGHVVVSLNVAPNNEDEWGEDILGRDVLANGETATISFERGTDECLWDLRATYDDNDTTEMKAVNLCEVATVTLTP